MKSKVLMSTSIPAISAFDLDYTLFSQNSSYSFGYYLYRKKRLSLRSLAFIVGCSLRHRLGLLSITDLHNQAFNRLFLGSSSLLIKQWALEFIEERFESMLYIPAIEQLVLAQEKGHLTILLSSSPDFLVEPIAKRLNIPQWNATQYEIDQDHRFCRIHKLLLGQDKADILAKLAHGFNLPQQEVYAYSDSHLDLPFLNSAGTAIGVNPDRKLRSICRQKQWRIL